MLLIFSLSNKLQSPSNQNAPQQSVTGSIYTIGLLFSQKAKMILFKLNVFCWGSTESSMYLTGKRRYLNKILLVILLFSSVFARSEDWTETSIDNSTQVLLSKEKNLSADGKKRFKVKSIFKNYRDIMGLQYNSTVTQYTISCESDSVSAKQQFAFNNDELVWTFPEFNKEVKASLEISGKLLEKVCSE